jgi:hypothetical protein
MQQNPFRNRSYKVICTTVCCLLLFVQTLATGSDQRVLDAEEYAVIAAVLFRTGQDMDARKNDKRENGLFSGHADLTGIPSSFIRLYQMTVQGKLDTKAEEISIAVDYNRRNALSCTMETSKLLPLVPKGTSLSLVSREEQRTSLYANESRDASRSRRSISSGVTYVSRPGFNTQRTVAIIQINHVADAEMGVGYRAYLKKSSGTGTWLLMDVVLNRRY